MIQSARKFIVLAFALLIAQPFLYGQNNNDTITDNEVARIINFLAADSLKGRGNGSNELLKAGLFIGDEFKKAGLQNLSGFPGYFLPFRPFGGSRRINSDQLIWNGKKLSSDEFIYLHPVPGNYESKNLFLRKIYF
jgi:hypothetical protein